MSEQPADVANRSRVRHGPWPEREATAQRGFDARATPRAASSPSPTAWAARRRARSHRKPPSKSSSEAFRHHTRGDDIEDLMEIAIQRANDVHLPDVARAAEALDDGDHHRRAPPRRPSRATIGHVGDSRLYRLTPDGQLRARDGRPLGRRRGGARRKDDARAGLESSEPQRHQPRARRGGGRRSRSEDVRSRRRHGSSCSAPTASRATSPTKSWRALLRSAASLEAACAEMKRRCFERGAEDNLTAVARPRRRRARVAPREPRRRRGDAHTRARRRRAPRTRLLGGGPRERVFGRRPREDSGRHTPAQAVRRRRRRRSRRAPGRVGLGDISCGRRPHQTSAPTSAAKSRALSRFPSRSCSCSARRRWPSTWG